MKAHMNTQLRSIPALVLALSACALTPSGTETTQSAVSPSTSSPTTSSSGASTATVEAPLYARDGSVVSGGSQPQSQTQQPVRHDAEPKREIGGNEGSRVYLLELYQKSMDEKNALSLEAETLRATLAAERKTADASALELERTRAELAQMTLERDGFRTQSLELAARVTSAQIARLEAEKSLLEHKIETHKREEAAAAKRNGSSSSRQSSSSQSNHGGGGR